MILLNDPKKYTLQLANRSLVGAENINRKILIAASVIYILPLLLVFLAFQRWTLDSNLDSGLK
ncbi:MULTISPECIES: maltose ABC transporter permease [unclassified Enterococcus]|uniref:maltose ABC transporter permease n=1 Tax=unclassified Enterococcus TaxID=2608891 RepID=UPI000A354862|nr:maltose ABC transporter permease [Enterococcus sp. 3C7_DIV0644]